MTVSTSVLGLLLLYFVVANAGIPNDHTVDPDQTLISKVTLNSEGSSAMSISQKLAGNLGMVREDVTALNAVTSTAFIIYMH